MTQMFAIHETLTPTRWTPVPADSTRQLAVETAVAIVVNGTTQAVLMATPADLEAFGIGFARSEGIISSAGEVERIEVIDQALGIEVRLWVGEGQARTLAARRRFMAGPTGCGLCGIESLEQAMRAVPLVGRGIRLSSVDIQRAMASLAPAQTLNVATRAVHAAALWHPDDGILAIYEDVGRHNALDKLVGGSTTVKMAVKQCALLLTSRVSIEMVQKAAVLGASILIAVSAPTTIAVAAASRANITLVGIARDDGFEVFTHPRRVSQTGDAAESALRGA